MIHHYSSFIDGGAGGAAIRLHQSLRSIGVASRFVYSKRRNQSKSKSHLDDSHVEAHWRPSTRRENLLGNIRYQYHHQRFKFATADRPGDRDLFTSAHGPEITRIDPADHHAGDVVHLHWINKFIDWKQFFASVPNTMPIVWTMHDMNPITGGCHFSGGCENFTNGCGNCFQIKRPGPNDISHRILDQKKNAVADRKIHVVAPSRWLIEQARRSTVMRNVAEFHRIAYSIDVDQFRPIDRDTARRSLGLDPDEFIVVFGAMGVGNARKGAEFLIQALSSLANQKTLRLVTFGNGELPIGRRDMPAMTELGLLADKRALQTAYAAANVFVMPSLEDNLPLTGLESLACGTPVIAFDAGGISDYVRPNQTGRLARCGSAESLAAQIRWAMQNVDQMSTMGVRGRQVIESEYAAPIEAKAYQALYRRIGASEKTSHRSGGVDQRRAA